MGPHGPKKWEFERWWFEGWGPEGWGSEGRGPIPDTVGKQWGSPNTVGLFVSLSRHNFLSFYLLLGVLSWNFGGVFEASGRSNVPVLGSRAVV